MPVTSICLDDMLRNDVAVSYLSTSRITSSTLPGRELSGVVSGGGLEGLSLGAFYSSLWLSPW